MSSLMQKGASMYSPTSPNTTRRCQESSFGTQAWCGCAPCTSGRWQFIGHKGFCGKGFAYFKYSLWLEVRAKGHFSKRQLPESHLHIADYGVASFEGF
jgi:hypothetical protein